MLESVKVEKTRLLTTLGENRAKHVEEFEAACEEYRAKAEKALRKRASEIRDGETLSLAIPDLPEPRSYASEYDRAIAMVEWSTEDVIELEERDFQAFVLDEWQWRGHFAATTSLYNNR